MSLLALAASGRGLVDPGEPVIRADDDGLLRGRAAFETLRVYGGWPFRLEAHLDRLASSAESIGLPAVERGELEGLASLVLERAGEGDAVLRLVWTGGPGGGPPTGLALLSEIPGWIEKTRLRGARAVSLLGIRAAVPWLLPGVKSTSYAVNMAAEAEARSRGAEEAIFVDGDDLVLEGTVTNIWWRKAQTLYTPSLELGILAGVTRATLLELAPSCGYSVETDAYPLDDVLGADEAFTSSSVREVMPLVEIDGRSLGRGPAADTLQGALRGLAATLSA
ncbi:MAG: aminotransferase class IV [Actinomycetota bacterium]|nr:aminotransferase class IV [Actinomycetota bacterium]